MGTELVKMLLCARLSLLEFSDGLMAFDNMVRYDKVTVHFASEREPMVVEQVAEIAKSHFPGSGDPAVQIIDVPLDPTTGGSLFDLTLNLADPSEIDYLVLQEGKEERVVRVRDLFDEWEW